ncbi:unnamed protein product [Boreogadus saida]
MAILTNQERPVGPLGDEEDDEEDDQGGMWLRRKSGLAGHRREEWEDVNAMLFSRSEALQINLSPAAEGGAAIKGPLDNIVAGVAWLRQHAGLLRGKVVEPAVRNMDPKEQQELLERIQDTDEEEKYPLLFTFDFQEDMEEVFHNMAAEEDLRVNAMFLGRWVDSQ